jgi:hypothetical protein
MGSKTPSLRDNQQKRKKNYNLNSMDFMGVICALNREAKFGQFL